MVVYDLAFFHGINRNIWLEFKARKTRNRSDSGGTYKEAKRCAGFGRLPNTSRATVATVALLAEN